MKKRFIKLINDERQRAELKPSKGCASAYDVCQEIDSAHCSSYAYDECRKDYRACSKGADDVCDYVDRGYCSGEGAEDNCYTDLYNCVGVNAQDNT